MVEVMIMIKYDYDGNPHGDKLHNDEAAADGDSDNNGYANDDNGYDDDDSEYGDYDNGYGDDDNG